MPSVKNMEVKFMQRWIVANGFQRRLLLISFIVFLCFFSVVGNATPVGKMKTGHDVLEVVIFNTNKHISDKTVIALANQVTPVLKKYPGFISRSFGENTNIQGQWIDAVKWKSLSDAISAAKRITANDKMQQFMSVMSTYKMYHFNLNDE